MEKGEAEEKRRDIRRFYCKYCGICRSKKALIASHVLAQHKDEMERDRAGEEAEVKKSNNTCEVCGACFKKPAYLKQHMLSHSLEELRTRSCEALDPTEELQNARGSGLEWTSTRGETSCEAPSSGPQSRGGTFERSYVCTIDDCRSTYRRKDHLNRHLLQHQGKLFKCPIENCKSKFAYQGNVKRHVEEFHSEDCPSTSVEGQKQHVCREPGCGKVFQHASRLRKHEDSHVKLDSVEAFCSEPECMKYFSNKQCLQDHIQSCHAHMSCQICGKKVWKKNIKSHLRTHEERAYSLEIKCDYEGCLHTFSKKSNLLQHVKAVHLQQKPFACSFTGCGKTFSYKHVRDNHEKSGCHVYAYGDFEEADEQFRSRPRGGRKRICPTVEMLVRKRVTPPVQFDLETEFLSKFFSQEEVIEE